MAIIEYSAKRERGIRLCLLKEGRSYVEDRRTTADIPPNVDPFASPQPNYNRVSLLRWMREQVSDSPNATFRRDPSWSRAERTCIVETDNSLKKDSSVQFFTLRDSRAARISTIRKRLGEDKIFIKFEAAWRKCMFAAGHQVSRIDNVDDYLDEQFGDLQARLLNIPVQERFDQLELLENKVAASDRRCRTPLAGYVDGVLKQYSW
jgi:hypothetical protein